MSWTAKDDRELRHAPDRTLLENLLDACRHFKMTEIRRILEELEKYSYESEPDLVEWLAEQTANVEYDEMLGRLEEILAREGQL
jgi:hypothetical protein